MDFARSIMRRLARLAVIPAVLRWFLGQRIWAVAALTWKAAFRFRLFWVLAALLLGSVVLLPLLLQDDGTARGFIQIMLTYTLSVITALLGFSTLWLACGTLARDIEDCSMQMVAVKPIARWQIWLGKFIGIMLLNTALLAVSGASVLTLLHWRAARLDPTQQTILRNEIFVARAAVREPKPDVEAAVNLEMQKVLRQQSLTPEQQEETRAQLRQRLLAVHQVVPPNHLRRWTIDLGLQKHLVRDKPLFIRVKFHAAMTNAAGSYLGLWNIGPPNSPQARSLPQSLAAGTFHEIQIPSSLFDEAGRLTIDFENRNETALIFPLEDGLEVLYREGGFSLNFARGLAVIACWLALLAALGLSAGSFLSFPVAVFCSIGLMIFGSSLGGLLKQVGEGSIFGVDHESGAGAVQLVNPQKNLFYKALVEAVQEYESFEPVTALSTGRSITWSQLGMAFFLVVICLGGVVAGAGIVVFTSRELAGTQTPG